MAVEIKDLGHGAYLVDGDVIRVKENAIGTHTEEGREFLVRTARNMKSGNPLIFHRGSGSLTMKVILPARHDDGRTRYIFGPGHYRSLPEDCRKILMEVFPEHASEI